jgi:dihydrofolate reductase
VIISLLAAMDEDGGIGKDGRLPWHLTDDLKHFRRLTDGHHVLMGRRTYGSIGGPLPGRTMIVLSRDPNYTSKEAFVATSFEDALDYATFRQEKELFVIGGAQIFEQALPMADRFYRTLVHTTVEADVFFPAFDEDQWELLEEKGFQAGGKNDFAFTIQTLQRIHNGR